MPGSEIAKAYIQLVPTMEGVKDAITKELGGMGESATQASALSEAFGGGMSLAVTGAAAAAGIALVATAVQEVTGFMKDAVLSAKDYADDLMTLSTNYHIATDELQAYQYMADLTDTSLSTITGSISRLTRNMSAAQSGTGDAAQAFARLGIDVTDAEGNLRSSSDVFTAAIDALGKMDNEAERDAVSMAIFGRSAMELNSLIAAGADGIRGFTQEAQNMGYILSDEEMKSLVTLDDEFARFDNQMTAIKNQIAAEMAPALIELAQQLLEVAQTVDWKAFGQSAATVIRELTPLVVSLAQGIADAANALAALIQAASAMKATSGNASGLYGKDRDVSTLSVTSQRNATQRSQPINVNVQLDSQTIARATYDADRAENNRVGNHAVR